jgi:hypothetical protein
VDLEHSPSDQGRPPPSTAMSASTLPRDLGRPRRSSRHLWRISGEQPPHAILTPLPLTRRNDAPLVTAPRAMSERLALTDEYGDRPPAWSSRSAPRRTSPSSPTVPPHHRAHRGPSTGSAGAAVAVGLRSHPGTRSLVTPFCG